MRAIGGADRLVGIGLVDRDHQIGARSEGVQQGIFDFLRLPDWHGLKNVIAGVERVHRDGADILHAAAAAGIDLAVPGELHLLGLLGDALVQRVELQIEPRPENRLRTRQDRILGVDAGRQR